MTIEQPILRVRKDHTYISLELIGLDLSHMCDKCNYFQRGTTGMEGRKPGKLELPKCEKPWYIRNGITIHTPYRLIEKKRKAIEILSLYNYKLQDDDVDKNSKSRLISTSYREHWMPKSAVHHHKINTSLNGSSDSETSLEPSSILEKNTVSTIKTNISSLPADTSSNQTQQSETPLEPSLTIETNTSLPPATPITMITLLSELYPRKYKRAVEMESEWCDTNPKK